jgi:HPt (histidine-containing phosphotransfer) domain-containing protein
MNNNDETQVGDEGMSAKQEADLEAELEAEIWEWYLVDAPLNMAAIREALSAGDLGQVTTLAHRLAGDSGAVGCLRVELRGRDLERAAPTPGAEPAELADLVHTLEQALTESIAERADSST